MVDELGARQVAKRLREAGFEAFYAGGCVRDLELGLSPKDYDITTNATPEEVTKLFRRTVQVGAAFGVVRVLVPQGEYEVATYRTDGTYSDGRRPDAIAYSKTKDEDVKRRDFTINALLMDPETREVLDYVGGREDLIGRTIRAVGDPEQRFAEDRLRMLRAIRFASRLGFEIEPRTWAAVLGHAGQIRDVSPERIVVELHALWSSVDPGKAMVLLEASGLWKAIFPGVEAPIDAVASLAKSGCPPADRPIVAWALVFGDAKAEERLYDFRLAKADIRRSLRLIRSRAELVGEPRLARRVAQAIDPDWPLAKAYMVALGGDPEAPAWVDAVERGQRLPPRPWVTGADLQAEGLKPGSKFKEILQAYDDQILEGKLKTREEALAQLKNTQWTGEPL